MNLGRDLLLFTDLPLAKRVRLARLAREWRQGDLASHAQDELTRRGFGWVRVNGQHVGVVEGGGHIERRRLAALLQVLGLDSFDTAVLP